MIYHFVCWIVIEIMKKLYASIAVNSNKYVFDTFFPPIMGWLVEHFFGVLCIKVITDVMGWKCNFTRDRFKWIATFLQTEQCLINIIVFLSLCILSPKYLGVMRDWEKKKIKSHQSIKFRYKTWQHRNFDLIDHTYPFDMHLLHHNFFIGPNLEHLWRYWQPNN